MGRANGPTILPMAHTIHQPTPDEIRAARERAGHSAEAAGAVVHTDGRTWRRWELGPGFESGRAMPLTAWELYLLKTGQRKL